MAYEFQHYGQQLLAEPTGGYRAGPRAIEVDTYEILSETRSELGDMQYEKLGDVSVLRRIPVEKDGAINPAFVHALRYDFDKGYAEDHDRWVREQAGPRRPRRRRS
ncbi:hypothetical protein [Rhizobium laguerreae]|uniref:hypothetical protein n=1 Tax=Rhizobium laguerreae TaxID=1076926 RepID=UPI001C9117D0|nr:hypothetical protein [Rhizobium laguerreae]MBY3314704.1 hypothetical protein [Rhizobium laguerreae]